MKRSKVSAVLAIALAGAIAASVAAPASADPTPQTKDIVGVGSDTIEFAMNNVADGVKVGSALVNGYNSTASARLVSFNATGSSTVVLKVGTDPIPRPNGSGAGRALLQSTSNNPNVNFSRASSSEGATDAANGVWQVPFAVDGLKMATATTSNAPASLTAAQLVQIYSGAVTNWNQLGGSNGVIEPLLPQANSGTRAFFLDQLKAANNGSAVNLASTVIEVQEHDPAPIAASANAVAPFSTGRFAAGTGIKLEGGFVAQRALYNNVRAADLTSAWFGSVFGPSGYLCSSAAQPLIEAAGFKQLSGSRDGGVCGVATQTATSNFAAN